MPSDNSIAMIRYAELAVPIVAPRIFHAEEVPTPDQVEGMLRLKMLWPDDESALPVGQKPMIMPTR
jgi:hypothetical protein